MKVSELVNKLDYLASHNMIDEDTEIILYAEVLPGEAVQHDTLAIAINGNCLQLLMCYDNKYDDNKFHPLGD